jgi:hypothetical protein
MAIKSDSVLNVNATKINLNNGVFDAVRNSPDFAQFLAAVATVVNGVAPGSCVLPTLYTNPTVKI